MNLDTIIELAKEPRYFAMIVAVIAVIILSIIIGAVRKRTTRKKLDELDIRYNALRSEPLPFKLQKTMALAKANGEVANLVPECKEQYDKVQEFLAKIQSELTEADDLIFMHKSGKARDKINTAEDLIDEATEVVLELSNKLDDVLQNESKQRNEITLLKEQYRKARTYYSAHAAELGLIAEYIEIEFGSIESLFTSFEDALYASEFDSSKEITQKISDKLSHLERLINEEPKLNDLANVTIKSMISEVNDLYLQAKEIGVVVNQLEVNKNLDLINEIIAQDINKLKNGNNEECEQSLEECITRLNQLTQQIEREAKAFEQFNMIIGEVSKKIDSELSDMDEFKTSYEKNRERFGYDNWDTFISNNISQLTALKGRIKELMELSEAKETPYTTMLITLKEYEESLKHMSKEIGTLRDKLYSACRDEIRAKEQVEKLYLTLHDIQVMLRQYRLPNISKNFELDLRNGYNELHEVENYLDQTPINIESLNSSLKSTIDYIYKLHERVKNLVGSANMVENAIVYANKYRSSYPQVDNELTHAELCFKNGEYTQALTIAIAIIEKIHPGAYESLIRSQQAKG